MLKKIILAVIIIGAGVLVYTEKTGKTHIANEVYYRIMGEYPDDPDVDENGNHYTVVNDNKEKPLSAGDQAIKDAGEYHQEAKSFAGKAANTANAISDASK